MNAVEQLAASAGEAVAEVRVFRGVWAWVTAAEERYWRGLDLAVGSQPVRASEPAVSAGAGLVPLPVIVAFRAALVAVAAASAVGVVVVSVFLVGGVL